jgi:hypothetical protein
MLACIQAAVAVGSVDMIKVRIHPVNQVVTVPAA